MIPDVGKGEKNGNTPRGSGLDDVHGGRDGRRDGPRRAPAHRRLMGAQQHETPHACPTPQKGI